MYKEIFQFYIETLLVPVLKGKTSDSVFIPGAEAFTPREIVSGLSSLF